MSSRVSDQILTGITSVCKNEPLTHSSLSFSIPKDYSVTRKLMIYMYIERRTMVTGF